MNNKLLKLAFSQLGEKEIKGEKNNQTIVNYAKNSGIEWISDDETPWCSVFINWLASELGLVKTDSAMARSWLEVGENVVGNPISGDIVIFWRDSIESTKGHVAVFLGFDYTGDVFVIGGNQGDSVSVRKYDSNYVLGYRRIGSISANEIPNPTLKIGGRSSEVKKLQKLLGIKQDGNFGPSTKLMFQRWQNKNGLITDGVYGQKCKDKFVSNSQY